MAHKTKPKYILITTNPKYIPEECVYDDASIQAIIRISKPMFRDVMYIIKEYDNIENTGTSD